jgi:hypothetical protein
MNTLIDKSLTALFRLAYRITNPGSIRKSEPANDSRPKVIKFSPDDVL